MARVLVAGCGDLGGRLAARLAAADHRVWGLRRRAENLPVGVFPIAADLADPATLASLPPDLDLVFYTAAADARNDEAYRRAYVVGVENLLAALAAQHQQPGRLFFTSSTGVYGQDRGEEVNEASPAEPSDFSGRRVLEGEEAFRRAPCPVTVVRLGGLYGPGRTRLIDLVRRGEAVSADAAPFYTNRIHAEDAAATLAHLGALEAPAELYLGVDCEPADRRQVLRFLARRLGVAPPPEVAPADGPAGARGKRCRNRRLLGSGFRFLYPTYREGYAALVAEAPKGS